MSAFTPLSKTAVTLAAPRELDELLK